MRTGLRWRIIVVSIVIVLALIQLYYTFAYYSLSDEKKITMSSNELDQMKSKALKLGLDLQGGMNIILEVDRSKLTPEESQGAVERAIQIIRNRVDQFGVTEPQIEKLGAERISVKLPGVVDRNRAKELIGKTAQLEFKILGDYTQFQEIIAQFDESQIDEEDILSMNKLAGMIGYDGFNLFVYPENYNSVDSIINSPDFQSLIPKGLTVMWGRERERDGQKTKSIYYIETEAVLKGDAILDARAGTGTQNNPLGVKVDLVMTRQARGKWASITGSNVGNRIAFVLDGIVISAPVVEERIPSGNTQITLGGSSTIEDAKDLSIILKAGALPAPVKIVEERSVGPSLGSDSIAKGIKSILLGLILILIFMAIYYSMSGLIADFALVLNLIILLAILSLFKATLTLPGMAGIVLIIGTAVDANVLIFERIREEMSYGKTIRTAIASGYSKAFTTILDANVTTFITAIILYWFGTGPIKGFAITLGIGLVVSFFTAIIVTRVVFDIITKSKDVKRIRI